MKCVILHYFFMVHLCNMKMSAAWTRHKSEGRHYDIEGFISQLLASRKFDELAEKLAEKAANKIMHKDAAPFPVVRATDDNETNNNTGSTQEVNKKQSNRENVNKYEKTQLNEVELIKDFTGKIDPQAVVNAKISLSENLQLRYKYFKKNALEKKAKSTIDPLPKNETKEELTKQNKTIGPSGFKDLNNKTQEPISNQSATDKNQMEAEKESIDKNKRSRDDTKNDDRKENCNRNSEINYSCDSETNDSSKKPDHLLEGQGPGHEQTVFHEAQHAARPQDKAIVNQEVSYVDNGIREEKYSSLEEDNQKHLTRSGENIIEKVEQNKEEPEKRVTEEINKNENDIVQFRAHEDSFEENKVTSENPNGGIYRSNASDESDDRSPEDRSPEDQSSKEQSAGDPNSSKFKPVIRKEGDRLYTYVRAPEYEDYHEKLAKWQKEHPDNPADFI